MNFGNEIKAAHGNLVNCLFNSNWLDQPIQLKKKKIIFMAILARPEELVIGKLYPLNLVTFTAVSFIDFQFRFFVVIFKLLLLKILKGAYSMFNLLQRFK